MINNIEDTRKPVLKTRIYFSFYCGTHLVVKENKFHKLTAKVV